MESVLAWGTLSAIHVSAIKASRQRYGWFYFAPIALFWTLVIDALYGALLTKQTQCDELLTTAFTDGFKRNRDVSTARGSKAGFRHGLVGELSR